MPERAPTATDRTTLLEQYVTEICRLAKELFPAAVVEVLFTRYEEEDAHVVVFLPERASEVDIDKLGEVLTKRSVEILLETGLLILAGVYEAAQRH
jgi:hypothetical protein